MDPLLVWFATQALGPDLVGRGLDWLAKPEWQTKLAKHAVRDVHPKVSWRRVRRWLDIERTRELLTTPSTESACELAETLAAELRPGLLRRGIADDTHRAQTAEQIAGEAAANLLQFLDAALAVQIADARAHRMIQAVKDDTEELLKRTATRTDIDQRLARLPATVADPVRDTIAAVHGKGLQLLDALTGDVEPARAIRELLAVPPAWLAELPASGTVALAEFAAAYNEHDVACELFRRLAEEGASDRPRWFIHAAMQAAQIDETRARELLDQAQAVGGSNRVANTLRAALDNHPAAIVAAAGEVDPAVDEVWLVVTAARARAALGERDTAIAMLRVTCGAHALAAGARVELARLLFERAQAGSGQAAENDAVSARTIALEARDLRRRWSGDAAEAVAIACAASAVLGEHKSVVRLGTMEPSGEARPEELNDAVHGMVAMSAGLLGENGIAAATSAQIRSPFLAALTAAEVAFTTKDPAAEARYREAWPIASTPDERLQVQLGLAQLGVWPLPGQDELDGADDARSAWVLAVAEEASGNTDAAIRRLARWRGTDLMCAHLHAELLWKEERFDDAVAAFEDAFYNHDDVACIVQATRLLAGAGRMVEAEALAGRSLASATKTSQRSALLEVLAAAAHDRGDWRAMERHVRAMLDLDPDDPERRWLLVGALFNQGEREQAWAEMRRASLDPNRPPEACLWMELSSRYDASITTWEQMLDLRDRHDNDERVHAACIMAVLRMRIDEAPPDELLERWAEVRDGFFDRYPNSSLIWRITFGESPQELIAALRTVLEAQALKYEEIRRHVWNGTMPYGLLALVARSRTRSRSSSAPPGASAPTGTPPATSNSPPPSQLFGNPSFATPRP